MQKIKTHMPSLLGITALMSLIAIANLPYGFYTLLRLLVFITGVLYLYFYGGSQKTPIIFTVFIVTLLWNPIIPVYLTKEIWTVLNLFVVVGCSMLIAHLKENR